MSGNLFFGHHTLKILPPDVTLAEVESTETGWALIGTSALTYSLWWDVTSQSEIESILLACNQWHLEQMHCEGGQSTAAPISQLHQTYGYNDVSRAALTGESISHNLTPELAAFFHSLQQCPSKSALTPVARIITSADVQQMFSKSFI